MARRCRRWRTFPATSAVLGKAVALDDGVLNLTLANLRYSLRDKVVGVTAEGRAQGRMNGPTAGPAKLAKARFDLVFPRLEARFGPAINGRFSAEGTASADSLAGIGFGQGPTARLRMSDGGAG